MTDPHPVRATDGLPHWYEPWLDIAPAGLAERSLAKWRAFVEATQAADPVLVLDGQLFHGDLTNLFLMDAGWAAIAAYSHAVEDIIRAMKPFLVYFYQDDVDTAIRAIAAERGRQWVKYQACGARWAHHAVQGLSSAHRRAVREARPAQARHRKLRPSVGRLLRPHHAVLSA
jgi:hypothetical protein